MRRTRVKICGLTRPDDAAAAVALGADALGVILAPSRRQVTLEQAVEVLAGAPPLVSRVGVFVDADADFVAEAVARCGLSAVQFSGTEDPDRCADAPVPVIKAIAVNDDFGWEAADRYRGAVSALLLDTYVPGLSGGTGRTFSWASIDHVPGWAPVIVAGGLTPNNVGACVDTLHPFAVDVCSGVETAPGIKDRTRMATFVHAVERADQGARE